ncbi:MAG: PleD family two-component system response regulator [Pseudomonadota bacterium]
MPGRILIVEDSATNRLILRTRLTNAYYDVVEAEDGPSAIEMASSANPDIILLDIMMPGMDGFEVCRHLKSSPETVHIPVVMLTALDKQSDRVTGLEAGADDFLSKPFEEVALMSRVASLTRIKMMVDELALREQTATGLNAKTVLARARAEEFPDTNILIVSSETGSARGMQQVLHERTQAFVDLAGGADEATAMMEFMTYDALLIDHEISDGNPLRLGSLIRARPESRQAATLLVVSENDLEMATKALEIGFNDYISTPIDPVELTARFRSLLRRKNYADQLRQNMRNTMVQAVTDPLTGTYNRRYANLHLDALIDRSREQSEDLAIMVLDLDRFKRINDTYGHNAGDSVLREFARRLEANVRVNDLVARMGGEEFMVVMPDVTVADAYDVAERVRLETESPGFEIDDAGRIIDVTVSIGFAVLQDDETMQDVIQRADKALYESKQHGRNRATLAAA